MTCKSCANVTESIDKFCNGCGIAVAVIENAEEAGNFLCLHCGTTLKGKKQYCYVCGTQASRKEPGGALLKRLSRALASPRVQLTIAVVMTVLVVSPFLYQLLFRGQRPGPPVDTVVSSAYTIHTVAGPGDQTDGAVMQVAGVAVAPDGTLFFVDTAGNRIHRIDPNGEVRSSVGTGEEGFDGDGGPSYAARLSRPTGIAFDTWGYLYVADSGNHRIRRVDPDGVIKTIAGSGPTGVGNGSFEGDGAIATLARLDSPSSVHIDPDGNIFFADAGNGRLRRLVPLRRDNTD